MEKRTLGRTGHQSTVVTFGAFNVAHAPQDVADQAIELYLRRGGNHIDIAPSYGEAMERMKPWMPRIRSRVFLGAKTGKRTKDEAWEDIRSCMKRLGVDAFDLFQLHAVATMDELDAVTGPGGALEALVEMRQQKLTRWIGITGHGPQAPAVHFEALRRFDFDTVMFPLNASLYRNAEYRKDAEQLVSEARSRNVGIQTIKMLARAGWGDRQKDLHTWYLPFTEQRDIDQALRWLLSQPIHTAPTSGDVTLLPKILDAAERFTPMRRPEQEEWVRSLHAEAPEPRLGIPAG